MGQRPGMSVGNPQTSADCSERQGKVRSFRIPRAAHKNAGVGTARNDSKKKESRVTIWGKENVPEKPSMLPVHIKSLGGGFLEKGTLAIHPPHKKEGEREN